jgi:hypothetical protein
MVRYVITVTSFLLCCPVCFSKRPPPTPVAHVRIGAVEYRAPNSAECPGCLEAWDMKTGKRIDVIELYHDTPRIWLETDVQWIFIKNLQAKGNELEIIDEKGRVFEVSLKGRRVIRVK